MVVLIIPVEKNLSIRSGKHLSGPDEKHRTAGLSDQTATKNFRMKITDST